MSRLTIEQAISHAIEVAEKNKANCERNTIVIPNRWISDAQCAEEHEQLAEWLEELKRYKDLEEQGKLIELPCKIGDKVWIIRNYRGVKHAQQGTVYEMYFTKEMKLMITVKYIGRGEYGKTIFATKEAAEAKLAEVKGN